MQFSVPLVIHGFRLSFFFLIKSFFKGHLFIKDVFKCFKKYLERIINISIFNFQNLIPVCIYEIHLKCFFINCYEIRMEISFFLYLRAVFIFEKCKLSRYGGSDVT